MLVAEEESADACSVAIVTACARRGAPDNPLIEEPTRRPSAHASADKKSVNACMGFGTLPGVRLVAIALSLARQGCKCVADGYSSAWRTLSLSVNSAFLAQSTRRKQRAPAAFLLPPELVLPPGR